MKDIRKILVKGLVPALETATSLQAYVKVPKTVVYPYIYISDIYQSETGPKDKYHYSVECLIQIVYLNQEILTELYDKMDSVLGIVNNSSPFNLDSPYTIEWCRLVSSSDTEILQENGILNIGLIRLNFLII